MDKRFSSMTNSNPVQNEQSNTSLNVPRSAFNYSCMHNFNANIGTIIPADVIECLPNEDYNLSVDILAIVRNPLVRRLFSGMRIYVHSYYSRSSDLWEGFNNFVTKGRSGDITLTIPKLKYTWKDYTGNTVNSLTPMSLMDYLGVPPMYYDHSHPLEAYKPVNIDSLPSTASKIGNGTDISALEPMMYQKICRDYYFNKNLLQNNKKWLPDNEDHFILSYDCQEASVIDYENENPTTNIGSMPLSVNDSIHIPSGSDQVPPVLTSLHYRQFKGDYFTTALPFADLIRGTAPTLDLGSITSNVNWSNVFADSVTGSSSAGGYTFAYNDDGELIGGSFDLTTNITTYNKILTDKMKASFEKATVNSILQGQVNLNNLRALEAYTIFMERNARTDGDYNSLIKAQFSYNPHQMDRKPIYIGGTYQDIVFNEILQTSETTSNSPLGSSAGRAASASSGYIGKFHSPDYGYIMTVLSIVPDIQYTQGIPRHLTRINQNEMYFPILNNLSPQAILNKELYISGDNSTDNDVMGYTERYSEFKSRPSRVSGLMALDHTQADYDASCVMARRFSETQQLNTKFVSMCPDNIDMSIFSVVDEPPFDISMACRVDKVSPMPYVTVPGGLSARA